MKPDVLAFSANPALARWVYLKKAIIIFVVGIFLHFSGQWRTTPLIDYRISLAACALFGLLAFYGLTRKPLTKGLTLDYGKRVVTIDYQILAQTAKRLEIPFEQLHIKTDTSFSVTAFGSKWKAIFLLDNQEKYSLSNDEPGFKEAELNDFVEKARLIAVSSQEV